MIPDSARTHGGSAGSVPVRQDPTIEWSLPAPGQGLRQGDVLEATAPQDGPSLLFVCTADCDLANDKDRGRLLCLPIVLLSRYFAEYRLYAEVERYLGRLEDETTALIGRIRMNQGGSPISELRLQKWIYEQTPDEILFALDAQQRDLSSAERVRQLMSFLATDLPGSNDLDQQVSWMQTASHLLNEVSPTDHVIRLTTKACKDFISRPPRDAYLVSEVADSHRDGYVVSLRFPELIQRIQVALVPGDPDKAYRRVATIASPYVYSISQQFGLLFTSVGLPDAQQKSVRIMGELLIESISDREKGL